MSLSRDVNLRTYRPLHHPHSDQPLLSPKDGGHTPANCIDDSSKTCAKTLSSSPSRSLFPFFFSFFLLFFFLYLLPAERPRVINQIIRRVRLDFCLATFEFGSRGFDDEGKDCCGGVDLPSFLLLLLPPPLPSFLSSYRFVPSLLRIRMAVCRCLVIVVACDDGLRASWSRGGGGGVVVAGTHRLSSGGGGALRGPTLVND